MESPRSSRRSGRVTVNKVANNKTKTKKISKFTHCVDCGFKSNRAFNVIRHYDRIHEPTKNPFDCCGKTYLTKGEYYEHCDKVHPETRSTAIISKIKYKITSVDKKVDKKRCRRSARIGFAPKRKIKQEKKEDRRELEDYAFDENTPLIFHKKNAKFFIKKEETIKSEVNENTDFQPVQIFFKGNASSPIHSVLITEYLKDIDFDHL